MKSILKKGIKDTSGAYRFSAAVLRQWKWAALDLLAPPACAGCGRIGSAWCAICVSQTEEIKGPLCGLCGGSLEVNVCRHCDEYPSDFDRACSFATYTEPFRRILLRFKYQFDPSLGEIVAKQVLKRVKILAPDADIAVAVPLGPERRAARGYNQVELFARPLADYLGTRFDLKALRRIRDTRSQVGLNGDERRLNLSNAFEASPIRIGGRRVLLIDDVFTTGATGNACARVLKNAGARAVYLFTLARAVGSREVKMEIA